MPEEEDGSTDDNGINSRTMSYVWLSLSCFLLLVMLLPAHQTLTHVWKVRRCVSHKTLNGTLAHYYARVDFPLWAKLVISLVVFFSLLASCTFFMLDLQYVVAVSGNRLYCAFLLELAIIGYTLAKMILYMYFTYRSYESFKGTSVKYNSVCIHSFIAGTCIAGFCVLFAILALTGSKAKAYKTHWDTFYCDFDISEDSNSTRAQSIKIMVGIALLANFVYAFVTIWLMVGKLFEFVSMSSRQRALTMGLNSMTVDVQMRGDDNQMYTATAKLKMTRNDTDEEAEFAKATSVPPMNACEGSDFMLPPSRIPVSDDRKCKSAPPPSASLCTHESDAVAAGPVPNASPIAHTSPRQMLIPSPRSARSGSKYKKKSKKISLMASRVKDSSGRVVALTPIGGEAVNLTATLRPQTSASSNSLSPSISAKDCTKISVDFAAEVEMSPPPLFRELSVSTSVRKGKVDTTHALAKFRRATQDNNAILTLSVKLIFLLAFSVISSLISVFILVVFNVGGTPQIFDLVCTMYTLWLSFTFADPFYEKIPCGQRLTDWFFPYVKSAALTWVCCGARHSESVTHEAQCFCGCGCNSWFCGDESTRTEQFMIFVMAKDEYALYVNRRKKLAESKQIREDEKRSKMRAEKLVKCDSKSVAAVSSSNSEEHTAAERRSGSGEAVQRSTLSEESGGNGFETPTRSTIGSTRSTRSTHSRISGTATGTARDTKSKDGLVVATGRIVEGDEEDEDSLPFAERVARISEAGLCDDSASTSLLDDSQKFE